MRKRSTTFLLLLLMAVAALSPTRADANGGAWADALSLELTRGLEGNPDPRQESRLVQLYEFYAQRDYAPLWTDGAGLTAKGEALIEVLASAGLDGLNPAHYGTAGVSGLATTEPEHAPASREVRLSLAMLDYASDLGSGRVIPKEVDPELDIYARDVDFAAVLGGAAAREDIASFLAGYAPQSPSYARLKAALADYRRLAAVGGWAPFPEGETLKPGMKEPRVLALRAQMRARGDLPASRDIADSGGDPERYDVALEQAVQRYQDRHGLTPDGVVGPATTAALNVAVEDYIRTMLLNMERRRWMADDLGARYVFVNLADFELKYVENGKTVFDSAVQVGSRYTRSPVFDDKIEYMVLNPYWHVPPGLAGRSLLPKIQKDPNYLADNNFVLFSDWTQNATQLDPLSVDWMLHDRTSIRRLKLRQGPGAGNALGRIKIMFPNEHNVYLHDTPAKSLFAKTVRSFSSGCIRVEHPVALGAYLLRRQPDWSQEKIQQVIDSGETRIVRLEEPVEVHLTYLTSWVNRDGRVFFRPDIYERDARLAKALLGAEQQAAATP